MKNKCLVFYSYRSHKSGYIEMLFSRLQDSANSKGLQLSRGSLKDLHIFVENGILRVVDSLTGKDLREFDSVYFELWYKAQPQSLVAAIYLNRHKIPFVSEELLSLIPMTKVGELGALSGHGVPIPNSFSSSNREIKSIFKSHSPIDYPLVVKADDAYGGKDNYLVSSYVELCEVLDQNKDKTFVVQEFIPNDFDYRCIVLGGEIKVVLKRQRSGGGHLNNTSQGAEGTICEVSVLSEQMQSDVLQAARVTNRTSFAGVDLLVSNNGIGHYILEVNQTPQIEIGSNINVKMAAMVDHLKGLMS